MQTPEPIATPTPAFTPPEPVAQVPTHALPPIEEVKPVAPPVSAPVKKKSRFGLWLLVRVLFLLTLFLAIAAGSAYAGYMMGYFGGYAQARVDAGLVNRGEKADGDSQKVAGTILDVDSPTEDSGVSKNIIFAAEASADVEYLQVTVTNGSKELADVKLEDFEEVNSEINLFEETIELSEFPTNGKATVTVVAFNTTGELKSVTIPLENQITEATGRLKIVSPDFNTTLTSGSSLTLCGEMQNFFEGVMSYRIVESSGKAIVNSGQIRATGDNYVQFSPFCETHVLPAFTPTSSSAKVVFFEESAKDGTEKVILEVPVKLK
jgi:hypothetical protein